MPEDLRDQRAKKTGYVPKKQKTEQSNHNANNEKKIQFFKDSEREIINEIYIEKEAKEWARNFIRPKRPQDKKLTSAQLRRFHNDLRALEAKIDAQGEKEFLKMLPLVRMIKSKVAYACPSNGRERKVPSEFREYLETMINSINDFKDFKAFSMCFEAVVGYFYGEGGR